jgi:hypothetical protein
MHQIHDRYRGVFKTSKTILNTKGDNVSIKCLNTLATPWNKNRFIIDVISIPFALTWGMNGRSFIEKGILVKNTNNGPFVCLDDATRTNLDVCTTMIIYAPYINITVGFEYDTYITTSNPAVSSSID